MNTVGTPIPRVGNLSKPYKLGELISGHSSINP